RQAHPWRLPGRTGVDVRVHRQVRRIARDAGSVPRTMRPDRSQEVLARAGKRRGAARTTHRRDAALAARKCVARELMSALEWLHCRPKRILTHGAFSCRTALRRVADSWGNRP